MQTINTIIKDYFRNNKIKLKDVSKQLNISQSNLCERLQSNRSITLDEFFILYGIYGDGFAMSVMKHYSSRILFLEKIDRLIKISGELKDIQKEVTNKNTMIYDILGEMEDGINSFSNKKDKEQL